MNKYDFTNYLTKGVIGFAAFSAYDVFVEKRDFGGYASSDAFAYAIGLIAAEWAADLLSHMIDVNGSSVSGMITKPLLTGLVYMYLYDYMVRPSYSSNRDNTNLFIMGSLSCLLLNYSTNPIMSLFGLRNNY